MNAQSILVHAVDPNGKWIYRVGGIAAFILVVGYLITFPVYIWLGDAPPNGVEAQLVYFSEHGVGWWVILGLMVFTDLLMIPIFLALYQALKGINRNTMLLAIACKGLFIALDLAVTWTAYSTLIMAGANYAAVTDATQRAVFLAAAAYPSAILNSPMSGTYAILIPSTGVLLAGLVMLSGVFNKTTAYLALATGVTGMIFMGSYVIDALYGFRYINALLAMIWYLFVGIRLYKLD
jgi:hypothetical protein